jgi:TolB-like protein
MRSATLLACATSFISAAAFAAPATQPSAPTEASAKTPATQPAVAPANIKHSTLTITPGFTVEATGSDADLGPAAKAIHKLLDKSKATTQPAPAEVGTVLVLPFVESAGASYPWMSRAIQQDLLVDLSRTTRARIDAPASTGPAADLSAAVEAGRGANAALVVYGQYQVNGGNVRITGQIVDVKTEKAGGSFSATGSMNNLFPVEDSVESQVLRELPPGWAMVSFPAAPAPGGELPAAPEATVPPPVSPPPQYYSYTYPDYGPAPDYSYDYGPYPYYWYSVPYYGPDLWFYGGFDSFHHFHHRWDGGHFDGHGGPHGFVHVPGARPGGSFHGGGGGSHGGGAHGGGGGGHR